MSFDISDKTYWTLSRIAYDIYPIKVVEIHHIDGAEYWEKIHQVSNEKTGFDASVYKTGNNIIITYRGTEGDDIFGRGWKDITTDINYIVGNNLINLVYADNQFTDSLNLAKKIQELYPDANISLTSHSLGGAESQYIAAWLPFLKISSLMKESGKKVTI